MKILALSFITWFLVCGFARADETGLQLEWVNQSRAQLQRHFDEGDYPKAMQIAEDIVSLLDSGSNGSSHQSATAIHDLAVAQLMAGKLEQSERNFTHSISMIEEIQGSYSPLVIPSLNNLAILYYRTNRLPEALGQLRKAQHITHRSDGVYSLDQLETLDWISKVLAASKELRQADIQERFRYRIHEENFGPLDPRTVPALSRLGDWLQGTGQLREALRVYRRAISIIEADDSVSQLRVLPFLKEISSSLYLMGVCCPDKSLGRALDIVVSDSSTDLEDEVEAMIRLADMHLLTKNGRKARNLYKQAWKKSFEGTNSELPIRQTFDDPTRLGILGASAVVDAYRKAQVGGVRAIITSEAEHVQFSEPGGRSGQTSFAVSARKDTVDRVLIGTPVPLCYSHVVDLVPRGRRDEISSYYMDLDFSVNSEGRVVAVKVDETNTPTRLGGYVKNLLKSIRYRPRMENGEPVSTDHLLMRQTFAPTESGHADGEAGLDASATIRGCNMVADID